MKKSNNILDSVDRKCGMRVPDGYFETVADRITDKLSDIDLPAQEPVTLWKRVQPWLYMAAMFAGIALMFKVFSWSGTGGNDNTAQNQEIHESTTTEIEDVFFYDNVTDYAIYEYIAEGY